MSKSQGKNGRPREAGDRYPGGRLKPRKPTPEDIERKARVARELAKGGDAWEAPLRTMLARGLIEASEYLIAGRYVDAYEGWRRAISATAPRAAAFNPPIAEESEFDMRRVSISTMRHKDIAAAWNNVFGLGRGDPVARDVVEERTMARWRMMNAAMTPVQRHQVFMVCVMEARPKWLQRPPVEAAAHPLLAVLRTGLRAVDGATKVGGSSPRGGKIEAIVEVKLPLPAPARSNRTVEIVVSRPEDEAA